MVLTRQSRPRRYAAVAAEARRRPPAGAEVFTRRLVLPAAVLLVAACLSACSRRPPEERGDGGAHATMDRKHYRKVIAECEAVLARDPRNGDALKRTGLAYYALQDSRRALPFLTKALELAPADLSLRSTLGRVRLALGQAAADVRRLAIKNLAMDRTDIDSLSLLVDASYGDVELADAASRLGAAARALDTDYRFHVVAGNLCLLRDDRDGAGRAYARAAGLAPDEPDVHLALGRLAAVRGNFDAAGKEYELACRNASPDDASRMAWADFLAQRGDRERARRILLEATQSNPDSVAAWYRLARMAYVEKQYPLCVDYTARVLAVMPQHFSALALRGGAQMALGDAAEAASTFTRMAAEYPDRPGVCRDLAQALIRDHQLEKAITLLRTRLKEHPEDTEFGLLLARAHLADDDAAAAVDVLQPMVRRAPRFFVAFALLANAYQRDGHSGKAVALLREMVAGAPDSAEALYLLGLALETDGKADEAAATFDAALALKPDFFPAMKRLVESDIAANRCERAFARVDAQRERHPRAAGFYYLAGKVREAQGLVADAERALVTAIRLDPSCADAYTILRRIYIARGCVPRTLKELEEAIVSTPNDTSKLMLAATLCEEQGDTKRAIELYETLLRGDPVFAPAAHNLARIYSRTPAHLDEAWRLAERARDAMPGDPLVGDMLAWILYRKGEYRWALGILKDCALRMPPQPRVLLHLGQACYAIGRLAEAMEAFERIRCMHADSPEAAHAARILELERVRRERDADATATALIRSTLNASPHDLPALFARAVLDRRRGNSDVARTSLTAIMSVYPEFVPGMLELAALLAENPATLDDAERLAQKARALQPDNADAARVLGTLACERRDDELGEALLCEALRRDPANPDTLYALGLCEYRRGKRAAAGKHLSEALRRAPDDPRAASVRRIAEGKEP